MPKRIPKKLKPKLQAEIVRYLQMGASITTACAATGVPRMTYYEWLRADPRFEASCLKAIGGALARAEATIQRAIVEGDVRCAQWYLERRNPEYRLPASATAPREDYEIVLQVVGLDDGEEDYTYTPAALPAP